MKKVEYTRTKNGVWIYIDNSLFKNENIKVIKTIKILELFFNKAVKYEGFILIDSNMKIAIKELNNLKCFHELIGASKMFFRSEYHCQLKIIFNNEQLADIVCFLTKNDLCFDGAGYAFNDNPFLKLVINDHDGSSISIEDKELDKDFKLLINKIINE